MLLSRSFHDWPTTALSYELISEAIRVAMPHIFPSHPLMDILDEPDNNNQCYFILGTVLCRGFDVRHDLHKS